MDNDLIDVWFRLDDGLDILDRVDTIPDAVERIESILLGHEVLFCTKEFAYESGIDLHFIFYPLHRIKEAGYSIEKPDDE